MVWIADARLLRRTAGEKIAHEQSGAVGAPAGRCERPKGRVTLGFGFAPGAFGCCDVPECGLQTFFRGGQLALPAGVAPARGVEFAVAVCAVEVFPLPLKHDADVEVRQTEGERGGKQHHRGGKDAGGGPEFDKDRPGPMQDDAGARGEIDED